MAIPTIAIVGVFVVGFLSLAGSVLPIWLLKVGEDRSSAKLQILKFMGGVAGGCVLSVGLIHSLTEAITSFNGAVAPLIEATPSDQSTTLYTYPWPQFITMMGILCTFLTEQLMEHFLTHEHDSCPAGPLATPNVEHNASEVHENEHESHDGAHRHIDCEANGRKEISISVIEPKVEIQSSGNESQCLRSFRIMVMGLSMHSFFVGVALGISNDLGLFIAIVAHQFFEGVAVGSYIVQSKLRRGKQIWVLDIVFSLAAPIGAAIGIGIQDTLRDDTFGYPIVNSVIEALSAGILVYVAVHHLMAGHEYGSTPSRSGRLASCMGVVVGCAIMSIIAIWV